MDRRTLLSGLVGLLPAWLVPRALRASVVPANLKEAKFIWAMLDRDGNTTTIWNHEQLSFQLSHQTSLELQQAGMSNICSMARIEQRRTDQIHREILGDLTIPGWPAPLPIKIYRGPNLDRWRARVACDTDGFAAVSSFGERPLDAAKSLQEVLQLALRFGTPNC